MRLKSDNTRSWIYYIFKYLGVAPSSLYVPWTSSEFTGDASVLVYAFLQFLCYL